MSEEKSNDKTETQNPVESSALLGGLCYWSHVAYLYVLREGSALLEWLHYAYLLCEREWLTIRLGLRQFSAQELIFGFQFRDLLRGWRRRNAFYLKKLFSFGHWFHKWFDIKRPNDKLSDPAGKTTAESQTQNPGSLKRELEKD